MPEIELDLAEAQAFGPMEEGPYDVVVTDVSEVREGPKAKYIAITFDVVGGEHEGRKLWNNYMVTGKAAGMFGEFWLKCTGEELSIGEGHNVNTDDLIDSELTAIVAMEEYEGVSRPVIKRILAKN